MLILHLERFEAEVRPQIADSQRDERPDHGTSDDEPGLVAFPGIIVRLPKLRDGSNHVPRDEVQLNPGPLGLLLLLVVVEPQPPLVGA